MNLNKPIHLTGTETIEELQALRQAAFQAAKEQGIFKKLSLIAGELGESLDAKYGPKYRFTLGDLVIYDDRYGNYLTVERSDQIIASNHKGDKLFAPGEWIDELLPLAEQAEAKRASREATREDEQRRRLAAMLKAKEAA